MMPAATLVASTAHTTPIQNGRPSPDRVTQADVYAPSAIMNVWQNAKRPATPKTHWNPMADTEYTSQRFKRFFSSRELASSGATSATRITNPAIVRY